MRNQHNLYVADFLYSEMYAYQLNHFSLSPPHYNFRDCGFASVVGPAPFTRHSFPIRVFVSTVAISSCSGYLNEAIRGRIRPYNSWFMTCDVSLSLSFPAYMTCIIRNLDSITGCTSEF